MKKGTSLVHGEGLVDRETGALNTPIYQSSTFHQYDINNFGKYDYSRSGNPTREALEKQIAKLENGNHGFAFSSGMAAISSVLSIFSQGDHLIICGDVYGGTYRAVTTLFNRFGIEITFVDASNNDEVFKAVRDNTKGIYLETPSNPLLRITDLKAIIEFARVKDILTIVDNTFMTPLRQRPLDLGADIVVHSATKFLGGHSDVIAGVVVVKDDKLAKRIYTIQNTFGAILGPQDCFLLLRGIKTLRVRFDESEKNAEILAKYLSDNSSVEKVYYPTLDNHEGREIHLSQSSGGGAVLSFKLKDIDKTVEFLNRIKNVAVAVSLGGVETIVSYPCKMSHASIPKDEREKLGITDTLIRVSVGLEEIEDLKESFKEALL
ncbi:MAG: trans-sulfuration enzyme family protein [Clostridium sp.]